MAEMKLTALDRFEKKLIKDNLTGCWNWNAGYGRGYGLFYMEGKHQGAHRASYKLYKGPIANGLSVLHSCDNPNCVNPDHLFLGTHDDNMKDKVKKSRQPKGANVTGHKLLESQILEIRAKYCPYKYTIKKLAQEYGISRSNIHRIISYKLWKHL